MRSCYELPIPLSSLLILLLFLEFCAGVCLLPVAMHRRKRPDRWLCLTGMVVSGVPMLLYTAEARARLRDQTVPAAADWLCRQPVALTTAAALLVLANVAWLFVRQYRFRRQTVTRSSIKEGLDKVNSGLCFSLEGGRAVLVNACMNKLSFALVGRDLQDADRFWNILRDGEVLQNVKRLRAGSRPSFRLPDGTVWTFAREELQGFYQLTAANTTRLRAVTDELEERNVALAALNLRLRQYGENMDELTRSKERLEIKARIHGEWGQALLSTRRYLLDTEGTQPPPLQIWQRNISMLRTDTERKKEEQPMEMLARIAASMGISVKTDGDLPEDEHIQLLFAQTAAEALTNAVNHAGAKTLYVELQEQPRSYIACFRNDGAPPMGKITEGGGLSSLRRKLEQGGGEMWVESEPDFALTVALPKERYGAL